MSPRQLKYFLAVVETGSISKAAIQCNVVQSALSQQLVRLEEELGQSLFLRSSKGVMLTHAGRLFVRHAQQILQQIDHAKKVVSNPTNDIVGTVCVGLPNSTASALTVPLLEACLQKYPGIYLKVYEALSRHVAQGLNNGMVDVAVLFSSQTMTGLNVWPLYTEELFVLRSSRQSKARPGEVGTISLDEFASQPLLLPEQGNGLRDLMDAVFNSLGISIEPRAQLGSVNSILRAVEKGIGISVLPWPTFAREEREGTITAHRIEGICIPRVLNLCTVNYFPVTEAAMAVISLIQQVVAQLIETSALRHAYR